MGSERIIKLVSISWNKIITPSGIAIFAIKSILELAIEKVKTYSLKQYLTVKQ
jgi:hypothetical protein